MSTVRRLLIANRGEIASRIIRSARHRGIETIAVYSDADRDLPYVRQATLALHLEGSQPSATYLNTSAILGAAHRASADAVHPGYGFLSENASFAQAVLDGGLRFVGPSPSVIAKMGSKIAAKELMSGVGVPVLPSVTLSEDSPIDDVLDLPFPLLVKASAGGGGRGMRIVRSKGDLSGAIRSAQAEALASFGDGTVFLEPYLTAPRHLEVQILGDQHGNIIHLFERECSIQRRYQKIVEEAPSPSISLPLAKQLWEYALQAGRALDYVGAGTVEFVVDESDNAYFLEVNTRLQVEHPVTELTTGLDLVDLQLAIADGEPLPETLRSPSRRGHAIEVRLYSEDPLRDYQPSAGRLEVFQLCHLPEVRVDAGYAEGNPVSTYYDAMLAKIIGYGDSRAQALTALGGGLDHTAIWGVSTNLELLRGILGSAEFQSGRFDTGFLQRHTPQELCGAGTDSELERSRLAAVVLDTALRGQRRRSVHRSIPSGWRNVVTQPQSRHFMGVSGVTYVVTYQLWGDRYLEIDGVRVSFDTPELTDDQLFVELDGVSKTFQLRSKDSVSVVSDHFGSSIFVEQPRFVAPSGVLEDGSLVSPMPATVVNVAIAVGTAVSKGDILVTVEAMKMRHDILAPYDGVVQEVRATVSRSVVEGEVLVILNEPQDPK